jgi:hypothetical protein
MNTTKTTRFTLDFRLRNLRGSGAQSVSVGRPFVEIDSQFTFRPQVDCFVDTGAAVSVVSWSLRREFAWKQIRTSHPELSLWNGVPSDFGETSIRLIDRVRLATSLPLRVVAKFVRTPLAFHNDRFIILGLNFLMDNAAKLEIAGQPWNLAGYLELS